MKGFFAKKWHGIPVGIVTAVLLVCMLAGSAFAIYKVVQFDATITVVEPLVVTEIQAPGSGGSVYAGEEIGLSHANGGKYFITNLSNQPITVTITVSESNGQMAWYGFKGFCATTGYIKDADTYNWNDPICNSTGPDVQYWTCTFELGTVEYVYADLIAQGKTRDQIRDFIGRDSSSVKFFVDGVVKEDANPLYPLNFTVTVTRG